jgi:histidinol-phosphatase (PHP family)
VIVDYHMHLRNERGEIAHDTWSVDPFAETARAAGVDEIGFTEHVDYFKPLRSLWTVPYQLDRCVYDLEPYVQAVVEARVRGLPVKLGLEVDYVRGREKETRELLARYPWDYLLGSLHFIDGYAVDGEPRLLDAVGVEQTWRIYFETLAGAAQSGLFDSLSHPDLVKMFGELPEPEVVEELHARAAEAIAAAGIAVEVSTAGLHRPMRELYPAPAFLRACRERGVPVTLGSDAHSPDGVGRDFDLALELLRSAGYETVTVFEQRRASQEPIG